MSQDAVELNKLQKNPSQEELEGGNSEGKGGKKANHSLFMDGSDMLRQLVLRSSPLRTCLLLCVRTGSLSSSQWQECKITMFEVILKS